MAFSFEAISIILILSLYGLIISMVHFKNHRDILLCNVFTNLIGFLYLYLNDAEMGAYLCVISGTASLIQYFLSEKSDKKLTLIRNTTAIIFSVIGVLFLYETPSDLLICSSLIYIRWSETRSSSQKLRYSAAYSGFAWAIYSLENNLYLMLTGEIFLLISASMAILNNRSKRALVNN